MAILLFLAFVALMFALVWAFFVARGTRLRDVIGKTDAPTFATCVLVLAPLVLFPIVAGHIAFAVSHGDTMKALLEGKASARLLSGEEIFVYFGGGIYDNFVAVFSLMFGGFAVLMVAICLKTIMYDGVVGLLRTALMAAAIATPAILASVVTYAGVYNGLLWTGNQSLLVVVAVLTAFLTVVWLLYRKDLMKGVRRRMTRPLAFAFLILWPFWFGFTSIVVMALIFEWMGYPVDRYWVLWTFFIAAFIVGVLIQSQLFRGIARISLLPRP